MVSSFRMMVFTVLLLYPSAIGSARRSNSLEPSNFTLLGAATLQNNTISLTSTTPSDPSAGTALYFRPVRFLEAGTGSPASFAVRFTFSIKPSPSFGDGLAFLITTDPLYLARHVGHLGLFDERGAEEGCRNRKKVTIAVEFDIKLDKALRDINDDHVGIDMCSIVSVASGDAAKNGVSLRKGVPMVAWISYSSEDETIRVWISYTMLRPKKPVLVANVDLNGIFREWMFIGFSASGRALHKVYKWSFSTQFSGHSTAAPSDAAPPGDHHKESAYPWEVLAALGFMIVLATAVIILSYFMKIKGLHSGNEEERRRQRTQEESAPGRPLGCSRGQHPSH